VAFCASFLHLTIYELVRPVAQSTISHTDFNRQWHCFLVHECHQSSNKGRFKHYVGLVLRDVM